VATVFLITILTGVDKNKSVHMKNESYTCDFYHCTVHLDNVKIPFFNQQMHLLLNT